MYIYWTYPSESGIIIIYTSLQRKSQIILFSIPLQFLSFSILSSHILGSTWNQCLGFMELGCIICPFVCHSFICILIQGWLVCEFSSEHGWLLVAIWFASSRRSGEWSSGQRWRWVLVLVVLGHASICCSCSRTYLWFGMYFSSPDKAIWQPEEVTGGRSSGKFSSKFCSGLCFLFQTYFSILSWLEVIWESSGGVFLVVLRLPMSIFFGLPFFFSWW